MYPFTKKILLIFSLILLTGCGVTDQNSGSSKVTEVTQENKVTLEEISDLNIVVMVTDDSVLIGATYYKISEKTKMLKANDQKLLFEEMKAGDLVYFEHEGHIMYSFPGMGVATSVVLQNDVESLNISKSIRNFLEKQEIENILSISIIELTDQSIILHFNVFEDGKKYEAQIDRATDEFTVKEIGNE